MSTFPGGKNGAGIYQRIINQIPPHDVYVEAFLGGAAILERKRPAAVSIGVEIDGPTALRTAARLRGRIPRLEIHQCSAFDWLTARFGLAMVYQSPSAEADGSSGDRSTFVYLDPPYLLSTRLSGSLYENELTVADHVQLLAIACQIPCPVAISGYWSPLYAERLRNWRHISFWSQTRGGRRAREFLWMNYPAPTALHDYRYLGDNKRQRERITRKVRTWAAGLKRLPRLERQAIFAALEASQGPDA